MIFEVTFRPTICRLRLSIWRMTTGADATIFAHSSLSYTITGESAPTFRQEKKRPQKHGSSGFILHSTNLSG